MENNLLNSGLKETEDEDCHCVVQMFLYGVLVSFDKLTEEFHLKLNNFIQAKVEHPFQN